LRTASPLDPRRFFAGRWQGQGELVPHGPARLVLARESVRLGGRGEWRSGRAWRVHERFSLGSGVGCERQRWREQVAPTRVHARADDIPLGADIELDEHGFRFGRFRSWLRYRGVRFRLGCTSDTRLVAGDRMDATIRLDFLRIPVATLRLEIRVERD
jgi:hypothetical protein